MRVMPRATVKRAPPVCDHCKKKAATRFCDIRLDDQQGEHRVVGGINLCEDCWPVWKPTIAVSAVSSSPWD
jgi:hypothetical protein